MNYFAFASNMDAQRMKERGVVFSKRWAAHLSGYRLKFNKAVDDNPLRGYANIVSDDNALVEGVLYEIEVPSLLKLDKYEGYPEHYLHIPVRIRLLIDGQETCAITYIANADKIRDGLKPSQEYLNHLLAGKEFLSASYFQWLQSIETLD